MTCLCAQCTPIYDSGWLLPHNRGGIQRGFSLQDGRGFIFYLETSKYKGLSKDDLKKKADELYEEWKKDILCNAL